MSSFNGLEIGLCFLFGCILLVLSAELYYLLWWKKRFSKSKQDIEDKNLSSSNITLTPTTTNTFSSYFCCWKTSKSIKTQEKDLQTHVKKQVSDLGLDKDLVSNGLGDESLDLELIRLHNLGGPPRFLFTINEETKEDLESQRSKKGSRTLSDILENLDTPFLSPIASPSLKLNLEAYNNHGLNPLFYSNEFGIIKIKSSPPPTFKFLRDAEEKLLKRLMQIRVEKRTSFIKIDQDSSRNTEENHGCFVKLVEGGHYQVSTTTSPIDNKW